MSHRISYMGGQFGGELCEFMEAHCIRQYFTASEAPWQNGFVERNGGIWKAAARKATFDVGARGLVEMRRLASMVNWAKNVWRLARPTGHWSRMQVALVTSGREAKRRADIAGVARSVA